jgi:hypothetical protein
MIIVDLPNKKKYYVDDCTGELKLLRWSKKEQSLWTELHDEYKKKKLSAGNPRKEA